MKLREKNNNEKIDNLSNKNKNIELELNILKKFLKKKKKQKK